MAFEAVVWMSVGLLVVILIVGFMAWALHGERQDREYVQQRASSSGEDLSP